MVHFFAGKTASEPFFVVPFQPFEGSLVADVVSRFLAFDPFVPLDLFDDLFVETGQIIGIGGAGRIIVVTKRHGG